MCEGKGYAELEHSSTEKGSHNAHEPPIAHGGPVEPPETKDQHGNVKENGHPRCSRLA